LIKVKRVDVIKAGSLKGVVCKRWTKLIVTDRMSVTAKKKKN
jgi:hypothetical protein